MLGLNIADVEVWRKIFSTVYVLFQDGDKSAEISLPGCSLINNHGFSDEEIAQLTDYVENEQDSIYELANQINPMKAFLG